MKPVGIFAPSELAHGGVAGGEGAVEGKFDASNTVSQVQSSITTKSPDLNELIH